MIKTNLSVLTALATKVGEDEEGKAYAKVTCTPEGVSLSVTGNLSLSVTIPSTQDVSDEFTCSLRDLTELAEDGEIELHRPTRDCVETRVGRVKKRIRCLPANADGAQVSRLTLVADSNDNVGLAALMNLATILAARKMYSSDKPNMSGIQIDTVNGRQYAAASDGMRFSVLFSPRVCLTSPVLLPPRFCSALATMLRMDKGVWTATDVYTTGDDSVGYVGAVFENASGVRVDISCPRLFATFPRMDRLLARQSCGVAVFDAAKLDDVITAVASNKWASGKAVRMFESDGMVGVSLRTPEADVDATVEVEGSLPTMAADEWPHYTAHHLQQSVNTLRKLGAKRIRVDFAARLYPSVITDDSPEPSAMFLLLPRRA